MWIALTSMLLYSSIALSAEVVSVAAAAVAAACVFTTSRFSRVTASSMFLPVTRSSASSSVLARTSIDGDAIARSTSMRLSCMTSRCFSLRSCSRSRTMSLTLLSLCEMSSCV